MGLKVVGGGDFFWGMGFQLAGHGIQYLWDNFLLVILISDVELII